MRCFPNIYGDLYAALHMTIRIKCYYETLFAYVSRIVKALGPRKFPQYCTDLNGVKGFGPPDDVTVKAAAEW